MALVPFIGFYSDTKNPNPITIYTRECKAKKDTGKVNKNCLLEEKQKQTQENYNNTLENNHIEKEF